MRTNKNKDQQELPGSKMTMWTDNNYEEFKYVLRTDKNDRIKTTRTDKVYKV